MSDKRIQELLNKLQELHIETGKVIEAIGEITSKEGDEHKADRKQSPRRGSGGFNPGDPVYITNRIQNIPIGRRVTTADRAAIVRKVTAERVYFTTATGKESWRSPKNLKKISQEDYRRLSETK